MRKRARPGAADDGLSWIGAGPSTLSACARRRESRRFVSVRRVLVTSPMPSRARRPAPAAWAFALALSALATVHCGSSAEAAPAPAPAATDANVPATTAPGDDGGAASAPPPPACRSAATVQALSACIDGGDAPRACLARSRAPGEPACDADQDGLDDALEDAMLRSYAPVIAYNQGDGGHTAGDSEPVFPTNAKHYVAHSTLYWRVDGDDSTKQVGDAHPRLDGLRNARIIVTGDERRADKTAVGQGPNFWLCLNQEQGNYPADALVPSMEASRTLADGIDIFSVAHPSGSDPGGRYVVLEYMLFYPYNKFTLDNHEGDFEGGAVFVDVETGKVAAVYTDRHDTADAARLVPLEGPGLLSAKDPAKESPHYDVCSDTDSDSIGGVRFWDFGGARHHPVIYAAGGDHASYGYPGATKIKGVGCTEATMIRDVHNGNGPKLVPFENAYYTDWGKTRSTVEHDVHLVNLGERQNLFAQWSSFAGQWGCTLDSIPKSYPGPWDNERLCRHWLTNDWGAAPPFARSTASSCSP